MSDRVRKIVGEELYKQILTAGLKPEEFDLTKGLVPEAKLNEANNKIDGLNGKVSTYEKQLGETKELLRNSEEYKGKYDEMDAKYKADLQAKDKEIVDTKKRYLVESALTKEGAKHTKLLMSTIDLEKISVDGDNLIGFTDTINELKSGEYADLFSKTQNKGASDLDNTNTNNQNNDQPNDDSGKDKTEDQWLDIMKDY